MCRPRWFVSKVTENSAVVFSVRVCVLCDRMDTNVIPSPHSVKRWQLSGTDYDPQRVRSLRTRFSAWTPLNDKRCNLQVSSTQNNSATFNDTTPQQCRSIAFIVDLKSLNYRRSWRFIDWRSLNWPINKDQVPECAAYGVSKRPTTKTPSGQSSYFNNFA